MDKNPPWLSQIIEEFQRIKNKHGDVSCFIKTKDGICPFPPFGFEIHENFMYPSDDPSDYGRVCVVSLEEE